MAPTLTLGTVASAVVAAGNRLFHWGQRNPYVSSGWFAGSATTPERVGTATNWAQVSVSREFWHAITTDGKLYAAGSNFFGRLGDGTDTNRSSPVQIGSATNWVAVVNGQAHGLALRSNGTLWAWGMNDSGRLGDGTDTTRYSPVQVGSATDWAEVSVAADGQSTLARKTDGRIFSWGYNYRGQLGDGTTTQRFSPVQIGSATDWAQISAGAEHGLARKSNGALWAWGDNNTGAIGDGTTTQRTSPVQVGSATDWVQVSGGGGYGSTGSNGYSAALKSNGTLYAWGNNDSGRLGDGTLSGRTSPVQIGSATDWARVSLGGENAHTLALKTGKSLYAWGNNGSGQLGDGTTTQRTSPVQVGSDTDWTDFDAGRGASFGIR